MDHPCEHVAHARADNIGSHSVTNTVTPTRASAVTNDMGSGSIVVINHGERGLMDRLQVLAHNILHFEGVALDAKPDDKILGIKHKLRQGVITWVHVEVDNEHRGGVKWLTQCCRTAQRAGTPWTMHVRMRKPWDCQQLAGLRDIPGAQVRAGDQLPSADTWWITSAGSATVVDSYDTLAEAIQQRVGHRAQERWAGVQIAVDPRRSTDDSQATKRRKAAEDDEALGGLRTPHRCVKKLSGATSCAEKLRKTIDGYLDDHPHLLEHVATLGKSQTPMELRDAAAEVRERLIKIFNAQRGAKQGLQGALLEAIARELGDPDTEAVRWVATGSTPIGIERPITPCGVFPLAEPTRAATAADSWFHDWNYASFADHRAGAERILEYERDQNWLTWASTKAELERRYGAITCSRIGVIAKVKNHVEKLRLIHEPQAVGGQRAGADAGADRAPTIAGSRRRCTLGTRASEGGGRGLGVARPRLRRRLQAAGG